MATLNNAVQSLVDNLHHKMTSNPPLSAEEQTLIASAIEKLSSQSNWEKALIAVAEEHLNEATQNMAQNLASATSALTTAQADINTAKNEIQTQNAHLALIPTIENNVQTALDNFGQTNSAELKSNLAALTRPVLGLKKIESSGTGTDMRRAQSIFAVYSANGDTFAVRPSYTTNTTSQQQNRLEYFKIAPDGSSITTMKSHYVHSSTFYQNPTSYIYRYSQTAILPLASKDDAANIAYEVVYSSPSTAGSSNSDYAGVYCASSGYVSVTKPKLNINATDQWGINTITDHSWNYVGVLYDNNKHCLVMVDSSTSLLVEKYRDGNVTTNISIADNAALQAHVDNGDFTVVRFISVYLPWPSCQRRFDGSNSSTGSSQYLDIYGFFGKSGSEIRIGGTQYNAHYRFTEQKKLEPLNFNFSTSISQPLARGSNGVANDIGDLYVNMSDFSGNTLGIYHYQSKSDYAGTYSSYIGGALMCMNPYSHVGIINDHLTIHSTNSYYGNSRTCKA